MVVFQGEKRGRKSELVDTRDSFSYAFEFFLGLGLGWDIFKLSF